MSIAKGIMGLLGLPLMVSAVAQETGVTSGPGSVPPPAITIVGFGDSITQATIQMPDENKRWLNVLQAKLAATFPGKRFNVVNSGIGGNSTREAMARFESAVRAHEPDWVVLEMGGNNEDLAHPERIVGVEEFRTLLDKYQEGLAGQDQNHRGDLSARVG